MVYSAEAFCPSASRGKSVVVLDARASLFFRKFWYSVLCVAYQRSEFCIFLSECSVCWGIVRVKNMFAIMQ